jgi:hypothetical protein
MDIVNVPLKWVHCVKNLQPCVKFAWDFYDVKNLNVYAQNNPLVKNITNNAKDYMALIQILLVATTPSLGLMYMTYNVIRNHCTCIQILKA